jgi:hypothetical protein
MSMKSRVDREADPAHRRYGAWGVSIAPRWRVFENFLADMGERPEGKTLDRFPNRAGNYEPRNCRWATPKEQAANRRPRVPGSTNARPIRAPKPCP